MTERRDFYVYLLSRPDGTPCYVGKGHGNRIERHRFRCTNPHLANIIRNAGGDLPKVKVREAMTEAEAFAFEIDLIAEIGRESNGGPLVNMTDGGEGPTGYKFSPEAIARIAKIHIGNKYSVGRVASVETKARMRAAKLGSKQSPEHRAAIGAAHKGKKRDPAWGAKISVAKMGHKQSEATKEKLRSWVRTPELSARISAATKLAMQRPEVQAKLEAARNREKIDGPENRQGT